MFHYRLWDGFSRLLCGYAEPSRRATPAEQWRCGANCCDRSRIPTELWRTQREKRRMFANRCPKIHAANPSYRTTVAIFDIKRLKALQGELPKTRIALVRLVWSDSQGCSQPGPLAEGSPSATCRRWPRHYLSATIPMRRPPTPRRETLWLTAQSCRKSSCWSGLVRRVHESWR